MSSPSDNSTRLTFLDNLRTLLVLAVVLEHAAHTWDGLSWWPVAEGSTSRAAVWTSTLSDGLSMPLLFFIAGYFALRTIRRRSAITFLVGKLKRLGIPWLVCVAVVGPVVALVFHYTRSGMELTRSYADIWSAVMVDALSLKVRLIESMTNLMQADLFYQRYMWFLSLLLVFFVIFAVVHTLFRKRFDTPADLRPAPPGTAVSTLGMLTWLGLLTLSGGLISVAVLMFTVPGLANPEPLFSLGGVIQFRPSRLWSYGLYFSLGVIACRNQWFERGRLAGHLPTWAGAFILLAGACLACREMMITDPGRAELWGPLLFVSLNLFTAAGLGFLFTAAMRYWNGPNGLSRSLARQSYAIYVAHYPLVIAAQLALLSATWLPAGTRFGVAGLVGAGGGWLAGRYLINACPRTTIALALGLLAVMLVFIRP